MNGIKEKYQADWGCDFFFQTWELNMQELLTDDVHILFTHIITLKILIL